MAPGREQAELERNVRAAKNNKRAVLASRVSKASSNSTDRHIRHESKQPTTADESAAGCALAVAFRKDLEGIKSLVTCTICNQLLYEPYTLACGHTYCYSCLGNWFASVPEKTCPDCRERVLLMPASAFLVKQIVETFIAQAELMPADESVEQHNERKKEEAALVLEDKNSVLGLFKGKFRSRAAAGRTLMFDEADGVERCVECGHEYEGSDQCFNCGLVFNDGDHGHGFSDDSELDFDTDMDDFDENSIDGEMAFEAHMQSLGREEDALLEQDRRNLNAALAGEANWRARVRASRAHLNGGHIQDEHLSDSDEGSEGSLADFVVQDGPIVIESSDNNNDSDEDGSVRARRHRSARRPIGEPESVSSSLMASDIDEDDEAGQQSPHSHGGGSDSNTMAEGHDLDSQTSDDSEEEAPMSPVTRRSMDLRAVLRGREQPQQTDSEYGYSELEEESVMDAGGDVGAGDLSDASTATSVAPERSRGDRSQHLGSRRAIIDIDDASSDDSVRPPRRRRLRSARTMAGETNIEHYLQDYGPALYLPPGRSLSPAFERFLQEPVVVTSRRNTRRSVLY